MSAMSSSGSGAAMSHTKSHSPRARDAVDDLGADAADRSLVVADAARREAAAHELAAPTVLRVVHRDHHREVIAVRPRRAVARERDRVLLDREHVGVARERPDLVRSRPSTRARARASTPSRRTAGSRTSRRRADRCLGSSVHLLGSVQCARHPSDIRGSGRSECRVRAHRRLPSSALGYRGMPRMRSAIRFRWICDVPAAIVYCSDQR